MSMGLVNLRLTGGQVADCTEVNALMEALGEGNILLADKGYDINAIRANAAARKAWANIPPKTNRKGSFVFSSWIYRHRNPIAAVETWVKFAKLAHGPLFPSGHRTRQSGWARTAE